MNAQFFSQHLAAFGLFLAAALVGGWPLSVFLRLRFNGLCEAVCFTGVLGLGLLSHGVFLLGLIGRLNRIGAAAGLGALLLLNLVVVGIRWRHRNAQPERRTGTHARLVRACLVAGFVFVPMFVMALYPPTAFDSTLYHLPLAKTYLAAEAIRWVPTIRYAVFPQAVEMLFTLSMLFFDDVSAHLASLMMLCLSVLAVYACGQRHLPPRAGVWAAALFLLVPGVIRLGTVAYIDTGLGTFVTISIYGLISWYRLQQKGWLVASAIASGLAASAKYTALPLILGASVALFLRPGPGLRPRLCPALLFSLVSGAVGMPWYLYNLHFTGNPVWPFLQDIFGYSLWDREDLQGQVRNLLTNSSAQARYLAPLLPFACLAAAGWLDRLIGGLRPAAHVTSRLAIRRLSLLLITLPPWLYAYDVARLDGLPPVTEAQRDQYLAARLPSYPAYRFLNTTAGADYRLYALFDENMAYFAEGEFHGDWIGPWRYRRITDRLTAGEPALVAELRAMGMDYFAINRLRAGASAERMWPGWHNLCPVFVGDAMIVFRIETQPGC